MTEPTSMEQIRRARAFVDATYYPDGNLPSPRVPEACTAERPFGPCTKRCEQPAGHDGQHRAQCITWCNPHDISTDIANLWSGPKDLWNTADGGQIIGQMVTRYCRNCPWMEEHMCAFGEDGDCDHPARAYGGLVLPAQPMPYDPYTQGPIQISPPREEQ